MSLGWKIILAAVSFFAVGSSPGSVETTSRLPAPEVVNLGPGAFSYRLSGEFTRDGWTMMAPMVTTTIGRKLSVMRHQVTTLEYRRCVEARACAIIDPDEATADLPVARANWHDASAYAAWLSRETGEYWRLPTDPEWAYAAASLFEDDALPASLDGSNPGLRALALYDRDADRRNAIDKALRSVGGFGTNENGLLDLAGNVWEWTDTCFKRSALGAQNRADVTTVNCGVRVVEGRHRAYMTDFIRDPRTGGCAVGTPPVNLGFRLVRDADQWRGLRLVALAQRLFGLD
jgi:formylglycine-generating enzyme required for sulfatase activity